MTPDQKRIVSLTWDKVVPIAGTAADLFYQRLFELDPDLERHFANTDLPAQKRKLLAALGMVINGLGRPDDLAAPLANLGRKHADYGVAARDYDTVAQALLWTPEQGLGDVWTDEVADAWTAAYTMIATQMQAGCGQPCAGRAAA